MTRQNNSLIKGYYEFIFIRSMQIKHMSTVHIKTALHCGFFDEVNDNIVYDINMHHCYGTSLLQTKRRKKIILQN